MLKLPACFLLLLLSPQMWPQEQGNINKRTKNGPFRHWQVDHGLGKDLGVVLPDIQHEAQLALALCVGVETGKGPTEHNYTG